MTHFRLLLQRQQGQISNEPVVITILPGTQPLSSETENLNSYLSMGKIIVVSTQTESLLKGHAIKEGIGSGVLIGANSGGKDYVIYCAATPPQDDETSNELPKPRASPRRKAKTSKSPVDFFDHVWIAEHARQVVRMLPGGINILGLYVVTKEDPFVSVHSLRQALVSVRSSVASAHLGLAETVEEPVILHVCSSSGKITGKSIDLNSGSSVFKHAEVKVSPACGLTWLQLHSNLTLDWTLPVTSQESKVTLRQQLEDAFRLYIQSAQKSVMLFGSEIKPDAEPLIHREKKGKGRSRQDENDIPESIEVTLLLPDPDLPEFSEEPSVGEIRLTGQMALRSLVHSNVDIGEAKRAVYADILRSLWSRCEMHCDSLIGEEQRGPLDSRPVIHEPPRRVMVQIPESPLFLSDYLFPGEKPGDTLPSVGELFDLHLSEEDVEDTYEKAAVVEDFNMTQVEEPAPATENRPLAVQAKSSPQILSSILLPVAVAVGFLAIAVAYILLKTKESL